MPSALQRFGIAAARRIIREHALDKTAFDIVKSKLAVQMISEIRDVSQEVVDITFFQDITTRLEEIEIVTAAFFGITRVYFMSFQEHGRLCIKKLKSAIGDLGSSALTSIVLKSVLFAIGHLKTTGAS